MIHDWNGATMRIERDAIVDDVVPGWVAGFGEQGRRRRRPSELPWRVYFTSPAGVSFGIVVGGAEAEIYDRRVRVLSVIGADKLLAVAGWEIARVVGEIAKPVSGQVCPAEFAHKHTWAALNAFRVPATPMRGDDK